ncbi:MAG: CDP-alcohol phosphatidyltransferase family protein [Deltaproteobacteria bacterium]|nr:CDP-alcohol phosphatidyltransferase family protein [Deltaproteobacteria bacterium]
MALPLEARRPFNFAHALTSLRLILTPVFLLAIEASTQQPNTASAGLVIGLFLLICASDYYDGPLARALGRSSDFGKVLDNLADITFLLVTLTYLVRRAAAPWWIPAAIALAFGQYTVDSWLLSGKGSNVALVPNPIGHWAGILNYIFTGILALHAALQQQLLPTLLYEGMLTFWLMYLLLAISMRFRFFLRTYRTPSSFHRP